MEGNKFLQEYLDNNGILQIDSLPSDLNICVRDVNLILNKQEIFFKQRIELAEKRTISNFYKKLMKKVESILNCELDITDYSDEVYNKVKEKEQQLDDFKIQIDLPDEEWEENELE